MQFEDIDFLIIGAGKSATTWLQMQLQSDPSVYMPDPELHYFSRRYDDGPNWYLSQFSDDAVGKTVGEKSNSYLYEPDGAARIHKVLPHAKLIVQLRDPVERAYSHYCMLFRRGEVGSDIETYLNPASGEYLKLLHLGNYASHLENYVSLFGRENLLVLFFEGVKKDPEMQMSRVQKHLGLQVTPLATVKRERFKDKEALVVPPGLRTSLKWMKPLVRPLRGNTAFETVRGSVARKLEYPALSDDLRSRMNDYYAPKIGALEDLSGQSLKHWLGPVEQIL